MVTNRQNCCEFYEGKMNGAIPRKPFFVVADLSLNQSQEAIARSYCDEILTLPGECTLVATNKPLIFLVCSYCS